jgi:PII-like signaling protein
MRAYIGEANHWKEKPLHKTLVEAMCANDIASVMVHSGKGVITDAGQQRFDSARLRQSAS